MIATTWTGTIARVKGAVLPVRIMLVSGPSMVPTLRDGDRLLVWRGAPIRPGDIVLGRFLSIPDRVVVKRAVERLADGWLLASDNTFAGGDSRTHGTAQVFGRVLLRWPRGSCLPRRVASRL